MSGQFRIRQPLANDLRYRDFEALRIRKRPLVIAKRLLVNIPEQRFDRNVRSVNATLQEAPEVLHPIRVDLTVNIVSAWSTNWW